MPRRGGESLTRAPRRSPAQSQKRLEGMMLTSLSSLGENMLWKLYNLLVPKKVRQDKCICTWWEKASHCGRQCHHSVKSCYPSPYLFPPTVAGDGYAPVCVKPARDYHEAWYTCPGMPHALILYPRMWPWSSPKYLWGQADKAAKKWSSWSSGAPHWADACGPLYIWSYY